MFIKQYREKHNMDPVLVEEKLEYKNVYSGCTV